MRDLDGNWHGISIDLWRAAAEDLNLRFEFHEASLAEMLEGTRTGRFDAAVAAITVTAEREQLLDFTHPFYTTGLAIAVPTADRTQWLGVARALLSPEFFQVVTVLALVLLAFGALTWLFERRRNPEQFGGGNLQGIGAGFWWAAVTMTTVGYGDKAPVTLGGRLVALVWMFGAIIIISSFTAAITSALTVSQLSGAIGGPEDLPRARVTSVSGSTSAAYLERNHIGFRSLATLPEAMQAVAAGKADACVYDAPLLKYLASTRFAGQIRVLPGTFERQDYSIALPRDSELRKALNQEILTRINSRWWQDTLFRHLGG
ncbi:transporter substrate-binding domain-containing protein [Geoalkalibacter halelectricus]|uniref:Transporter substrate-binding domain-containing protein n=2 Tax=Geoalkalibacter halelectricus TaxID=2847045 RepID=A0ABY5ZR40_9BACT|nr:transporter substrate-binding domain-containing protein [Geoalkalibacter halelectricus]UWZ81632.1 transporter substrate-binding domain-containing protein [Geoalkalibacter halelectricus]